jgi:putative tRNA adenosine deaminase-associated protein
VTEEVAMTDDPSRPVPSNGTDPGLGADSDADFAVAAYREDGAWVTVPLRPSAGASVDAFVAALRRLPAPEGALGLAAYDDDFCLLLRVRGHDVRVLLSDATAADDWSVAREVLERLGLDPDFDEPEPAGDLRLLADLGMPELDLAALCEDPDLYPDEMLADVAGRLGFGEDYERAVESAGPGPGR